MMISTAAKVTNAPPVTAVRPVVRREAGAAIGDARLFGERVAISSTRAGRPHPRGGALAWSAGFHLHARQRLHGFIERHDALLAPQRKPGETTGVV
jgi:hypothetical protein